MSKKPQQTANNTKDIEISEELAQKVSMSRWYFGFTVWPKLVNYLLLTLFTLVFTYACIYCYWTFNFTNQIEQIESSNIGYYLINFGYAVLFGYFSTYFFTLYYEVKVKVRESEQYGHIGFLAKYLFANRLFFSSFYKALFNAWSFTLFFCSWVALMLVYTNCLYEFHILPNWTLSVIVNVILAFCVLFIIFPYATFLIWRRANKAFTKSKFFFAFALANSTSSFITFAIFLSISVVLIMVFSMLMSNNLTVIHMVYMPLFMMVYFHFLNTEIVDNFELVNENLERLRKAEFGE